MPRYTQGLMDLGSSLCTPRNPACPQCPLHTLCVAHREGAPERYPVRTRTLKRCSESWWLLVLQDPVGRVWLSRRPASGIWAGLYCVPVFPLRSDVLVFLDGAGPISVQTMEEVAPFLHVLTHRDLHLHTVIARQYGQATPDDGGAWCTAEQFGALGLPAPVRKLLAGL